MDDPTPSSLVETLGIPGIRGWTGPNCTTCRTSWCCPCCLSSAVPTVSWPWPSSASLTRLGCALSRAVERDPLARHADAGLRAAGGDRVQGAFARTEGQIVPIDGPSCIVTLNAMGCRKRFARRIRKQEADHVLRVRANHQGLHDRVEDTRALKRPQDFVDCPQDDADTVGKDHSRIGNRRCRVTGDPACPSHVDPDRREVRPGQPGPGRVRRSLRQSGYDGCPLLHFQPALRSQVPAAGGAPALEHCARPPLGHGHRLWRGRQPHPHGLRRP